MHACRTVLCEYALFSRLNKTVVWKKRSGLANRSRYIGAFDVHKQSHESVGR